MELKNGGQVEKLKGVLKRINFNSVEGRKFELWLISDTVDQSLSYLSLEEMLILRDEINQEIKQAIGI